VEGERPSNEGGSEGPAATSKRRRVGARSKRVYECTTCGKAFSRSGHLAVHTRTHSGDRPYACATCGKAFSTAQGLTYHDRSHSGDRPYTCTTCGRAFSQSSDLKKHRRTHSGDRPYAYDINSTVYWYVLYGIYGQSMLPKRCVRIPKNDFVCDRTPKVDRFDHEPQRLRVHGQISFERCHLSSSILRAKG
jgi:hypothetical protein